MAFLRDMRETLFGASSDPRILGRDDPNSPMTAAKLAKSSKLTTSANDLPLEGDPLSFTYLTYPQDLTSLQNGHYIKFDVYENTISSLDTNNLHSGKFSKTITGGKDKLGLFNADVLTNLLRMGSDATKVIDNRKHIDKDGNALTGLALTESRYQLTLEPPETAQKDLKINTPEAINMDNHSHTHNKTSTASILLYTPSSNKFVTAANYENAETGFLGDFIGGDSIAQKLASVTSKIGGAAAMAALEIVVPGAGGFFNRSTGMAVNPNMEVAFKSVPFRSFNFEYKFAPKSTKELNSVHKIIQLLRYHMSPALIGKAGYFASPSQFVLSYMYREKENNYIPKIAKCVLENLEVEYSPGEKFTTLKPDATGASPQVITVQLQFKEMSIITKQSIAKGY